MTKLPLRFTRLIENYAHLKWSRNSYRTVNTRVVSAAFTCGLLRRPEMSLRVTECKRAIAQLPGTWTSHCRSAQWWHQHYCCRTDTCQQHLGSSRWTLTVCSARSGEASRGQRLHKEPEWEPEKTQVLRLLPAGLERSSDPRLSLLLFWACCRQILNIASLTWVQWRHSWQGPAAWHQRRCRCDSSHFTVK